jgi:hypothetical protein
MTDTCDFVQIQIPIGISKDQLALPDDLDIIEEIENVDIMCVICNEIRQNIIFKPCNHENICSLCYVQLAKKRECPICKQYISYIEKFNN